MSKNIKEIGKELLGKSLNSFHRKTGLTQLEKNNEMQDGILNGIYSQIKADGYIEKTSQEDMIHLENSGDGVVELCGIEGNSIVNYSTLKDSIYTAETIEGEGFITLEDTEDSRVYIDEIWGNTWQDSDGKNLFDEKSLSSTTYPERRTISYIGNKIVVNNLIEYSYTRESHDMSINLKAGTYTLSLSNVENTNNNYCAVMLGLDNEIIVTVSANDKIKYKTFTVSSDCNVTVETNVLGTYIGEFKFNVQLEEGAKATEYEPYYKADLSDIKSVGELYVDDEGNPILDDLGREQYKIEIESCNKNLFSNNIDEWEVGSINGTTGENADANNRIRTKHFIKIPKGSTIFWGKNNLSDKFGVRIYDKSKKCLFGGGFLGGNNTKLPHYDEAYYLKFVVAFSDESKIIPQDVKNFIIQVEINSTGTEYVPHQSHKTTILLPCQLQKVGNVYDRLYWDSEKGKYVVEKNVGVDSLNRLGISIIATHSSEHTRTFFRVPVDIKKGTRQSIVKGILNKYDRTKDMFAVQYDTETMLFIRKSLIKPLDPENITDDDIKSYVQKLLSENEYTLYYQRETPELIETNITEKILLPCYEEKTHIFVNSTVDATKIIGNGLQHNLTIPLETNTTYNIRFNCTKGTTSQDLQINLGGSTKTISNGDIQIVNDLSITTGETISFEGIRFIGNVQISDLIVSKQELNCSRCFEGLQSSFEEKVNDKCKYEIEILIKNKNLFDGEMEDGAYGASGVEITNPTFRNKNKFILVEPNTKYNLQCINSGEKPVIHEYDENKTFIRYGYDISRYGTHERTKYINFRTQTNTLDYKFQLEKGDVLSEYIPHKTNKIKLLLNEPLRAIGDVKDRLCINNGKLVVERYCDVREYQEDDLDLENVLTDMTNTIYLSDEIFYEEVTNEYGEPILLEGYENGTIYIDSTIVPTTTVRYTPKMESFKTLKEVENNNVMLTNDVNDNIIPYMMDVDLMIMEKEMALMSHKNIRKMEVLDMTSMQKRTQDMLERLIKGKTLTEQECKTRVTTYLNAGKITDAQAEELMLLISEIYA